MATLVAGFLLILIRTAKLSQRSVEDVLALQVQNADLTRALHHRATHDSLSDLINHGEFNRRLERLARDAGFLQIETFSTLGAFTVMEQGSALIRSGDRPDLPALPQTSRWRRMMLHAATLLGRDLGEWSVVIARK